MLTCSRRRLWCAAVLADFLQGHCRLRRTIRHYLKHASTLVVRHRRHLAVTAVKTLLVQSDTCDLNSHPAASFPLILLRSITPAPALSDPLLCPFLALSSGHPFPT